MNASGTAISDFIYFSLPISLLPICRNRAAIKRGAAAFADERCRLPPAASMPAQSSCRRPRRGVRQSNAVDISPQAARPRMARLCLNMETGTKKSIRRFETTGKILTCSIGPQSFACGPSVSVERAADCLATRTMPTGGGGTCFWPVSSGGYAPEFIDGRIVSGTYETPCLSRSTMKRMPARDSRSSFETTKVALAFAAASTVASRANIFPGFGNR
jgi:hypothetical protein